MSNYRWLLLALAALLAACSSRGDSSKERDSPVAPITAPPPPPPGPFGPGAPVEGPRAGTPAPPPPPMAGTSGGDEADAGSDRDGGSEDDSCPAGQFCPGRAPGCGTVRFETNVDVAHSGNLLIIFDQSVSMRGAWQMTTKIEAARAALVAAITPLQNELTVGALFLPSAACLPRTPQGGAVAPIDAASQIKLQKGPEFLASFALHWAMVGNNAPLGTPLNEAFDRADVALQAAKANLDLRGKLGVVVFTDGEPNCAPNPDVTGVPTLATPERAARWAAQDIRTYVVGLPGARGVQVLDQIAQSGGTMGYLTPDDPTQLATTLKQVVEEQITRTFASCSITLTPPAEFPDQLRLFVTRQGKRSEVERMGKDGAGWTISDDGAKARLEGALCKDAEAGLFDSVTFEHGCKRVPPPPPPPPIPPPD